MIREDTFIVQNPVTRCFGMEEGVVLYNPDTGRKRLINEMGRFIWERFLYRSQVRYIAKIITNEFEGATFKNVLNDLIQFAEDLYKEGFILVNGQDVVLAKKEPSDILDGPREISIAITGRCNLKCEYCFYADEMVARSDLKKDEWIDFFYEIGHLPVESVTLTGGEVFTRSDIWELIDALINVGMRYSILTNGTLITKETIEKFNQDKRRIRLNSIQVSIDGSSPKIHDKIRGKGAFEKAVNALRLLKEENFPVTVRVTVNKYNIDDLEAVAKLLLEDIGLQSFTTNDAMPMGSGCQNRESIALSIPEQRKAMEILTDLTEAYNGRITAMAGPLAKARSFAEMEEARATGKRPSTWQMGYLTSCGGVFNKLDVLHDGSIVPCHMLHKLVLGRVGKDSIKEIWKEDSTLKALRERRSIAMRDVPGCEDCEWAPYCSGGCPGLSYEMTGDFNHANSWDCYKRFIEEAGRWNYREARK